MAQKDTLRYVILGLLSAGDLAGYDMKKLFESEVGDFWYASHSQIYPELKKMEQAGLISSYTQRVGEKVEKRLYRLTEKGKRLLNRWMEDPLGSITPSRDEFTMKVYLIRDKDDPRLPALFEEEIQRRKARLDYLKYRWDLLFSKPGSEEGHYGHALILNRAIRREEGHLRWLKKVRPGKREK